MSTFNVKLLRPPEYMMRYMAHNKAKVAISCAMGASSLVAFSFYFLYVEVRRKALIKYGKNYDPYKRIREICEYPVKYMHTCPSELAKRFEKKGLPVPDLDYSIPLDDVVPESRKKEFMVSNALERFLRR